MFEFYVKMQDDLLNEIINKSISKIKKQELGFINNIDNCNLNIACTILHAIENHQILNDEQKNNIINIYNNIKYAK